MSSRVRSWKKAHKQRFKQEKKRPTPKMIEEKRQQLENYRKGSVRKSKTRRVERVVVRQRPERRLSKKEKIAEAIKEQIAQGGRQFHLEQMVRSKEFREQNSLPSGVLGSDVPGLVEEQRNKQSEMVQKLKGSNKDT